MHLQHTLKELVPLGLVIDEVSLGQVDGLRNAAREVHQCVGCVASIQSLVTACQPGEQRGKNSPLMLLGQFQSFTSQQRVLKLREVKQTAVVTQPPLEPTP